MKIILIIIYIEDSSNGSRIVISDHIEISTKPLPKDGINQFLKERESGFSTPPEEESDEDEDELHIKLQMLNSEYEIYKPQKYINESQDSSNDEEIKGHKITEPREKETQDNASDYKDDSQNNRTSFEFSTNRMLKSWLPPTEENLVKNTKVHKGRLSQIVPETIFELSHLKSNEKKNYKRYKSSAYAKNNRRCSSNLTKSFSSDDKDYDQLLPRNIPKQSLSYVHDDNIDISPDDFLNQLDKENTHVQFFYKVNQENNARKINTMKPTINFRNLQVPNSSSTIGKRSEISINKLKIEFKSSSLTNNDSN